MGGGGEAHDVPPGIPGATPGISNQLDWTVQCLGPEVLEPPRLAHQGSGWGGGQCSEPELRVLGPTVSYHKDNFGFRVVHHCGDSDNNLIYPGKFIIRNKCKQKQIPVMKI